MRARGLLARLAADAAAERQCTRACHIAQHALALLSLPPLQHLAALIAAIASLASLAEERALS